MPWSLSCWHFQQRKLEPNRQSGLLRASPWNGAAAGFSLTWFRTRVSNFQGSDHQIGMAHTRLCYEFTSPSSPRGPKCWRYALGKMHQGWGLRTSCELTTRINAYIHADSRLDAQQKARGTTYAGLVPKGRGDRGERIQIRAGQCSS